MQFCRLAVWHDPTGLKWRHQLYFFHGYPGENLFSVSLSFSFLDIANVIIQVWLLWLASFTYQSNFRSSISQHVSVIQSFLLMNCTSLYGYTTFYFASTIPFDNCNFWLCLEIRNEVPLTLFLVFKILDVLVSLHSIQILGPACSFLLK